MTPNYSFWYKDNQKILIGELKGGAGERAAKEERMREVGHLADTNPRELAFIVWARGWRCPKCGALARVFSLYLDCQLPENRFAVDVGVRF